MVVDKPAFWDEVLSSEPDVVKGYVVSISNFFSGFLDLLLLFLGWLFFRKELSPEAKYLDSDGVQLVYFILIKAFVFCCFVV